MITRRSFILTALATLFTLVCAAPVMAQDGEMAELQKRFKARDGEVRKLKSAGTVGETSEGYLDFVESRDKDGAKVVDDENADRRKLYKLIAEKEGTTPDKVAKINAKRNFERARAGEFLKEEGKWRKKS
jgi:uncharacterized protein YdbL (DUF1318 family)